MSTPTRNRNRNQSVRRPASVDTPATPSTPPDHRGLLLAAVLLAAIGWIGLYQLVTTTQPRIGGELWLFFILLQFAITGTVLPIVRYLNVRFTPLDAAVPPSGVVVRQSVWIGLYVVTCAWMQIPRALTVPVAAFLALALVLIEGFLRSREIAAERD